LNEAPGEIDEPIATQGSINESIPQPIIYQTVDLNVPAYPSIQGNPLDWELVSTSNHHHLDVPNHIHKNDATLLNNSKCRKGLTNQVIPTTTRYNNKNWVTCPNSMMINAQSLQIHKEKRPAWSLTYENSASKMSEVQEIEKTPTFPHTIFKMKQQE
jgi:hypothetical protein